MDGSRFHTRKNWAESNYAEIYGESMDWMASPTVYQNPNNRELIHGDIHINSSGQGVWVYVDAPGEAANHQYRMRYTTNGGATWSDSVTNIFVSNNATSPDNFDGSYYKKPRVFVDEDGSAVLACIRYGEAGHANMWGVYAYYSEDLINWAHSTTTSGSGLLHGNASFHSYIGDIYVREKKAVILAHRSDNADSKFYISTNTGSGYDAFDSGHFSGNDFVHDNPTFVRIQYDGSLSGDQRWRITILGIKYGAEFLAHSHDGAGGNQSITTILTSGFTHIPYAVALDSEGDGNNMVVLAASKSGTQLRMNYTSSPVGSTMVWKYTDSGAIDLNSAEKGGVGTTIGLFNGYNNQHDSHMFHNQKNRAVLKGNHCYVLLGDVALNGGQLGAACLLHTKDLNGGVWESYRNIGTQSPSHIETELCMAYVPSSDSIVVAFRRFNSISHNQAVDSAGYDNAIYSRVLELNTDGSFEEGELVEISDGTALKGMVFNSIANSADSVTVGWEMFNGSYDDLHHNVAN